MDKCTYFIQLLIVLGGLVFIDAQLGYGRRRIIPRRRFYPRSYPEVDPYGPVRRRHYPSGTFLTDPYFDDAVRPAVVVGSDLISGRRPIVITDRTSSSNQDTNVVNNNRNNNHEIGSNNVVVSQTTGRRRCTNACEDGRYRCPFTEQCVADSTCEGGRCRSIALGGIVGGGLGDILGDGLGGIVGGGHLVGGHVGGRHAGGGHFIH